MILEILRFYVSGFWTWLGITIGLALLAPFVTAIVMGIPAAIVAILSGAWPPKNEKPLAKPSPARAREAE